MLIVRLETVCKDADKAVPCRPPELTSDCWLNPSAGHFYSSLLHCRSMLIPDHTDTEACADRSRMQPLCERLAYNFLSAFSLPSKTRRRTLGSPKRTRTQSTSLEAKPRRRYAVVNIVPELALHV